MAERSYKLFHAGRIARQGSGVEWQLAASGSTPEEALAKLNEHTDQLKSALGGELTLEEATTSSDIYPQNFIDPVKQ